MCTFAKCSTLWRTAIVVTAGLLAVGCERRSDSGLLRNEPANSPAPAEPARENGNSNAYLRNRERMLTEQLRARDIHDERVLGAMQRVPRHAFVPVVQQSRAYSDCPLPIGHGQTISQPYIVALMTQLVEPQPHKKALDVGTGSGYQAAVLAELVDKVYSIEILEPLAEQSAARLKALGYQNIHVQHGDGYRGWPSEAPFEVIIVAAAPDHVPPPLVEQLARGGKMVIPVGDDFQQLLLIEKDDQGEVTRRNVAPVAFVPMTGEAQR